MDNSSPDFRWREFSMKIADYMRFADALIELDKLVADVKLGNKDAFYPALVRLDVTFENVRPLLVKEPYLVMRDDMDKKFDECYTLYRSGELQNWMRNDSPPNQKVMDFQIKISEIFRLLHEIKKETDIGWSLRNKRSWQEEVDEDFPA